MRRLIPLAATVAVLGLLMAVSPQASETPSAFCAQLNKCPNGVCENDETSSFCPSDCGESALVNVSRTINELPPVSLTSDRLVTTMKPIIDAMKLSAEDINANLDAVELTQSITSQQLDENANARKRTWVSIFVRNKTDRILEDVQIVAPASFEVPASLAIQSDFSSASTPPPLRGLVFAIPFIGPAQRAKITYFINDWEATKDQMENAPLPLVTFLRFGEQCGIQSAAECSVDNDCNGLETNACRFYHCQDRLCILYFQPDQALCGNAGACQTGICHEAPKMTAPVENPLPVTAISIGGILLLLVGGVVYFAFLKK